MKNIFASLLLGALALSAQGAESAAGPATTGERSFIIKADIENGLALIPEGTVVPHGIKVYVRSLDRSETKIDDGRLAGRDQSTDARAPQPEGRPLVFAYAPDRDFDAARKAIAAGQQKSSRRPVTNSTTSYWTIYVVFPDGSYHAATRDEHPATSNWYYLVQTQVSSPGGDWWMWGTLTAEQSSPQQPFFNGSVTCQVDSGAGGSCGTDPLGAISDDEFIAGTTVYSTARIFYRAAYPCGLGCQKQTYESTIQISFP